MPLLVKKWCCVSHKIICLGWWRTQWEAWWSICKSDTWFDTVKSSIFWTNSMSNLPLIFFAWLMLNWLEHLVYYIANSLVLMKSLQWRQEIVYCISCNFFAKVSFASHLYPCMGLTFNCLFQIFPFRNHKCSEDEWCKCWSIWNFEK